MPGRRWRRPDTSPRLHDPFDAFYLPVRLSVWLILRGSALRMNQLPIRILAWKLGIGIHPPPLPGKRTNAASSTRAPCIPRCRGPDCGTYFATEVPRIEPVWRDTMREGGCAPRASGGARELAKLRTPQRIGLLHKTFPDRLPFRVVEIPVTP
jgi:hypothetical protein